MTYVTDLDENSPKSTEYLPGYEFELIESTLQTIRMLEGLLNLLKQRLPRDIN